ncbi:MAG: 4Fe-4S dicluster domain-containing protein [Clostridiales bacterium]|nr:4Fe-4S dicluster domain-containing protein [Clostridiales bacterium]
MNNLSNFFKKKLGFGFMRLPLHGSSIKDINYDEVSRMTDLFIENGFNYFETAYPYHNGMSEIAIHECLTTRYQRNQYILADKMTHHIAIKKGGYEQFFMEQLIRCGVDYFDIYYIHNVNGTVYDDMVSHELFEFVSSLKGRGYAKSIGFSFHDNADLLDQVLIKYPDVDFVQLQLNYLDWESPHIQSRKCYEIARKHNKTIFVMEPIKGGALANVPNNVEEKIKSLDRKESPVSLALRYVASLPGVEMVLSGMSNIAQLQDNVNIMTEFKPLSQEEQELISQIVDMINSYYKIQCTACLYCVKECPKNIRIPELFHIYNSMQKKVDTDRIHKGRHISLYNTIITNSGHASDCIKCGKCEKACPQYLPIRRYLEEISYNFRSDRFSDDFDVKRDGKYIVYGTGKNGLKVTNYILQREGVVIGYCDSDMEKAGTLCQGKPVFSVQDLKYNEKLFNYIVIASNSFEDIILNLNKYNINMEQVLAPKLAGGSIT